MAFNCSNYRPRECDLKYMNKYNLQKILKIAKAANRAFQEQDEEKAEILVRQTPFKTELAAYEDLQVVVKVKILQRLFTI